MATDAEAMAYIYPASLDSPLTMTGPNIPLRLHADHGECRKTVPADVRADKLDSYRMGMLRHLKR